MTRALLPAFIFAFLTLAAGAVAAAEFRSVAEPSVFYDAPTLRGKKLYVAPRGMPVEVVVSIEGWQKVVDRFPGSIAAGNALLRIAAQQSNESHYPDADKTYQRFVREYPKHPFAVNGLMGLATNAEAENKPDAAIKYYAEIAGKYGTTYLAPMALLSQARLSEGNGQLKEARQLYEMVVQRYPQSVIAQIASVEASRLNEKLGNEGKQTDQPNLLTSSPQPSPSGRPSPTASEKPKQQPEP